MSNSSLEIVDGRAIALGRENLWQALGQVTGNNFGVEEINATAPEILSPVEMCPTYIQVEGSWGREYVETPNKAAIIRTLDNKVIGEGVGKQSYGIVQPMDAYEWGSNISGFGDLPLVSAGTIRNGSQFFFSYQMGDEMPAGIKYTPYLTVTSSHDGSVSLMALFSTVVTCCANVLLASSYKHKDRLILKHTINVDNRMEMTLKALRGAAQYVEDVNQQIERLAVITVRNFDPLLDALLPSMDTIDGQPSRGATLRETARDAIRGLLSSKVIEDDHRNTGWAFIQAVNTYEQWNAPIRGGQRATRQFDAAVKGNQPLTRQAINRVLALV
jgi:phage/plasmid-like protein (TIGR03299 family)